MLLRIRLIILLLLLNPQLRPEPKANLLFMRYFHKSVIVSWQFSMSWLVHAVLHLCRRCIPRNWIHFHGIHIDLLVHGILSGAWTKLCAWNFSSSSWSISEWQVLIIHAFKKYSHFYDYNVTLYLFARLLPAPASMVWPRGEEGPSYECRLHLKRERPSAAFPSAADPLLMCSWAIGKRRSAACDSTLIGMLRHGVHHVDPEISGVLCSAASRIEDHLSRKLK